MDQRANVVRKIEQMIRGLSNSLPESELNNGWTEVSRQAMLKFFEELHSQIMSDQFELAEPQSFHIARALDHWGIVGGDLLEDASEIQVGLRELFSTK